MSHVLIVDDDDDDRDLFCEALSQVNPFLTCTMARHGEEALKGLKLQYFPKPDLIFLDLNMPRINGIQCLTELKKDTLLYAIPVVIYTTSKLDVDRELTSKLGAAYFITKPTSFEKLCRQLKSILVTQDLVT